MKIGRADFFLPQIMDLNCHIVKKGDLEYNFYLSIGDFWPQILPLFFAKLYNSWSSHITLLRFTRSFHVSYNFFIVHSQKKNLPSYYRKK